MQLPVGITDVDIVMIDQADSTYPRPRSSLGCPRPYPADTDDAKMSVVQMFERGLAKYAGEAFEAF